VITPGVAKRSVSSGSKLTTSSRGSSAAGGGSKDLKRLGSKQRRTESLKRLSDQARKNKNEETKLAEQVFKIKKH